MVCESGRPHRVRIRANRCVTSSTTHQMALLLDTSGDNKLHDILIAIRQATVAAPKSEVLTKLLRQHEQSRGQRP